MKDKDQMTEEKRKAPEVSKDGKKPKNFITAAIFGAAFLICIFWIMRYFVNIGRSESKMEQLRETYVLSEEGGEIEEGKKPERPDGEAVQETVSENRAEREGRVAFSLEGIEAPEKEIDFDALKEENPDIYAWITIPDTSVDYPILQDEEEADYYLMHNLDGSSGYPGCIYTQYYNSKDWTDNNTVIYGHNMKDGSMFAALHSYKDTEFFEKNPYIYIYGEDGIRVYQVFAAYETGDAHLLLTNNTDTKEGFAWYLGSIFSIKNGMGNNFNRTLGIDSEDKIISLETCISNKPTRRYVVQAVLIAWEKKRQ